MKHKYGMYPSLQFEEYKKDLHNKIHRLLVYAEEENPILINYFDKVQFELNGLNELIMFPKDLIKIMNLVESVKLEYLKNNYNHKVYRKTILDIHGLIDKLPSYE